MTHAPEIGRMFSLSPLISRGEVKRDKTLFYFVTLSLAVHVLLLALVIYFSQHNKPSLQVGDSRDSGVIMINTHFLTPGEMEKLIAARKEVTKPEAAEQGQDSIKEPENLPRQASPPVTPPKTAQREISKQVEKPVKQASPKLTASINSATAVTKPADSRQIKGREAAKRAESEPGERPSSSDRAQAADKGVNPQPQGKVARALQRMQPIYPERARVLGIEGEVKVLFDVDSSGQIDNIRVLTAEADPILVREVRKVMRRWRYESLPSKDLRVTIVFKISSPVQIH